MIKIIITMHYTLDYYISRNPAKTTRQTVSKKEICLVAAVYDSEIKDFFLSFATIFQWLKK